MGETLPLNSNTRPSKKLKVDDILIYPDLQQCATCTQPTHFATFHLYVPLSQCPTHLASRMTKRSYVALLRDLYSVVYMHEGNKHFEPQRGAWEALSSGEQRWEQIGCKVHTHAHEKATAAVKAMTLSTEQEAISASSGTFADTMSTALPQDQ